MTRYTWFHYVETDAPSTHILAWNPDIREWVVPCGNIDRPHRDTIAYSLTKSLCRSCVQLTQQRVTRTALQTRHR